MPHPLDRGAVLFARAGASAHEAPHSLASFRLALRLGATGLQGDVWSSGDGVAVLDGEGHLGGRFRRRSLSEIPSNELAGRRLSLSELYDELGKDFELLVDLRDPVALDSVLEAAMDAKALHQLWLMSSDLETLERTRSRLPEGKLLHSTRMADLPRGPEHHAAELRRRSIDGASFGFEEWTAGHVALFHRFTRLTCAWGPRHERQMRSVLAMGIDAVVSAEVERMVDSATDGSRITEQ